MEPQVDVRPVSPADGEAWREHWRVRNAVARETGGDLAQQIDPDNAARLEVPSGRVRWQASAVVDGQVVGTAAARVVLDDDPTSAYLDAGVLAAWSGRGIGTRLATAALDAARAHGAVRADAWVAEVAGREAPVAARALATRLGMVRNAVDVVRQCPLPLPDDLPATPPSGYQLDLVEGAPGAGLFDDLRVLLKAMNADVPQGEHALPMRTWPDDALRTRFSGEGEHLWLVFARTADGRVAGFTELGNPDEPTTHHRLDQGDTLVLAEHRGHGLGLAMKVAAMRHACRSAPWMTVAQTSNDETNGHMVAINERLGFREVARMENWTWLA